MTPRAVAGEGGATGRSTWLSPMGPGLPFLSGYCLSSLGWALRWGRGLRV